MEKLNKSGFLITLMITSRLNEGLICRAPRFFQPVGSLMPENGSGFPQIKYWKKISLWKKLKYGLKTTVFQSRVFFCMLVLIRLTAGGGFMRCGWVNDKKQKQRESLRVRMTRKKIGSFASAPSAGKRSSGFG